MKATGLALCLLCAALPAHAIVGGALDPNVAASPWAGVGAVKVNGGTFSGALIGTQYVLTAAHVVGGAAPDKVQFVLNADGAASQTLAAESIFVFPGFTGTTVGADGVWHDDLALVKLAQPVAAGVPVYTLYDGALLGQTISLVGYGASETAPADPTIKRTGQNRVDQTLVDDDGGTNQEIYLFDFDGPDSSSNVFGPAIAPNLTLGAGIEAQFAGGDSGSPVFVNDNGVWKIAGIAAFNGSTTGLPGSNTTFGAIGGGTLIAPYASWIQDTVSAPVPEPRTWLMLLAGLGLVGVAGFKKKEARFKCVATSG